MSKPDEQARQFSIELARAAMRLKITPRMGMICFGHMGGLMIAHEHARTGMSVSELRTELLAAFTEAMDRGIADGVKHPPPGSKH